MKWAAIYIRSCILQASLPMMLSLSTCYWHGLMYSTLYSYTKLNDVDLVDSFLSVCYSSNQLRLLVFALNKAI